jgi:hypothetical protein
VLGYKRYQQLDELLTILDSWEIRNIYISIDGIRGEEDQECVLQAQTVARVFSAKRPGVRLRLSDVNLGCRFGVAQAITWFFQNVPYGAIIEEDVRVDRSFLEACAEILPRLERDRSIMHVNASSFGAPDKGTMFRSSKYVHPWGWASWARAWLLYSDDMSTWKKFNIFNQFMKLKDVGLSNNTSLFFLLAFKLTAQEKNSSWAFRWNWSVWANDGFSLLPPMNLSQNIGCNQQGSHTETERQFDYYPVRSLSKPVYEAFERYSSTDDENAFQYTYRSNVIKKIIQMIISTMVSRSLFQKIRTLFR